MRLRLPEWPAMLWTAASVYFIISAADGNSQCSYRISEINCNGVVKFSGQWFMNEPFIEIEAVCGDRRSKRSDTIQFFHDLSDYHLVIWNRKSSRSRIILPLFSGFSDFAQVAVGQQNFTEHGFFDYSEIKCPIEFEQSGDCEQWMPAQDFSGNLFFTNRLAYQRSNYKKFFQVVLLCTKVRSFLRKLSELHTAHCPQNRFFK